MKSEALLVGQWQDQAAPSLPGGLEWGKEGLNVLSIFLGWSGLIPFYNSRTRSTKETPGMRLFEEPLFFNSLIKTQTLQSASLRANLRKKQYTKSV